MKRILFIFVCLVVAVLVGSGNQSIQPAEAAKSRRPTITPVPTNSQFVRGINYNPMRNGTLESDPATIFTHLAALSATGGKTVGLYNCGLFDWHTIKNSSMGKDFCQIIYSNANAFGLNIVAGYFSNSTQDWTLTDTAKRATMQYQDLVNTTLNVGAIKYYVIGNEVFENLPSDKARQAYATWIGSMVAWTKIVIPTRPVFYADNSNLTALPYLKTWAPELSVYAINDYEWDSVSSLLSRIDRVTTQWPSIAVLLHEYGSDSWDVHTATENQAAQAARIVQLADIVEQVGRLRPETFLGALLFAFTDDWSKIGDPTQPTPDVGRDWVCLTCFDQKANEDYWGIYNKPAATALKNYWTRL